MSYGGSGRAAADADVEGVGAEAVGVAEAVGAAVATGALLGPGVAVGAGGLVGVAVCVGAGGFVGGSTGGPGFVWTGSQPADRTTVTTKGAARARLFFCIACNRTRSGTRAGLDRMHAPPP